MDKLKLRYYCKNSGEITIKNILAKIKERYNIDYEILGGPHIEEKDKLIYERDFKPRAKLLKKRTGRPITKLRSRKARAYFVSIPGTITVIENELVEWWTLGNKEIIDFLEKVLAKGRIFLESLYSS